MPGSGPGLWAAEPMAFLTHGGTGTGSAQSCHGPFLTLQAQRNTSYMWNPTHHIIDEGLACLGTPYTTSPEPSTRETQRREDDRVSAVAQQRRLICLFLSLHTCFGSKDPADIVFTWWQRCPAAVVTTVIPAGQQWEKQKQQWRYYDECDCVNTPGSSSGNGIMVTYNSTFII